MNDAERLARIRELLPPGAKLRSRRWRIGPLTMLWVKEVSPPGWTWPRAEAWRSAIGPAIRIGWRQTAYSLVAPAVGAGQPKEPR